MNSKLTLLWGFLIFLSAAVLFYFSNNSFISVFYVFISMFCGVFLIVFRKDVPAFSPIFMLFSSIFINIGFPALYFFMNKIPFSEELLKNISIVYLIYFFSLILPVFFVNQMFIPSNLYKEEKADLFKINFKAKNINFYLITSNLLLIISILILLKLTGFSYIEAFKHPLDFRFTSSTGGLAYIRKLVVFIFMVNTFLLAKYNFCSIAAPLTTTSLNESQSTLKLRTFTLFHIVLLLLFAVISGSRSVFFLPVISSIAIYTFYNRLNFKSTLSISIILILTLGLMSFYSVYRNNSKFHLTPQLISLSKTNIFNETVKRIDNFKNSLYFFEYVDKENNTIFYFKDFHLLDQMKDHILQPLPRTLIPEKGYYFSSLMTKKVFNSEINESRITYNFGGISNAFWNFGIPGVILEGLFLGIAVVWLHRKFLNLINYDSFFMFFMVTFFFIPNSIIVDGFWNTMDGCGYFLNLLILWTIISILSFNFRVKKLPFT